MGAGVDLGRCRTTGVPRGEPNPRGWEEGWEGSFEEVVQEDEVLSMPGEQCRREDCRKRKCQREKKIVPLCKALENKESPGSSGSWKLSVVRT